MFSFFNFYFSQEEQWVMMSYSFMFRGSGSKKNVFSCETNLNPKESKVQGNPTF